MYQSSPLIDCLDKVFLDNLAPGIWHFFRIGYAATIGGEPLAFPICIYKSPNPGPRLTITSGVHGDEFEGPRALWDFTKKKPQINRGVIIVVPVVNLPAYEAGTRTSPLDGMNLARVFPGQVDGLPSQRLAYTLFHQVVLSSDFLIDLHSGGTKYLHMPLMGFYDLPGSAGKESLAAARATGWKTLWAAPVRPGVLSYEAVSHGIPALGTEVGGAGVCRKEDIAIYANTFHNLLVHLGLADIEAFTGGVQTIIDGDWYLCSASGFLEAEVPLGYSIEPDMVLGRIYDPIGGEHMEIKAVDYGVLVGVRVFPTIQVGEWSFFVGKPRKSEQQ